MSEGFMVARVWRGWLNWLRDVPAADEVDRRNAPTLQVVLLMLALLPPPLWFYRIFLNDLPWRASETPSLIASLGLSVFAGVCVVLIRKGRVQLALRLLLGAVAVLLMHAYASQGMMSNSYEQPVQVAWLVVAGLMIGRRALWLMYLWIVGAFAAGTIVDIDKAATADSWHGLTLFAVVCAIVFLFVAVVVDRSMAALRESLASARARGDELARAKTRLEAEIVERERLYNQLVHSQKVEAVGRLAAGVAHDFNHLLTLVLGYAARGMAAGDEEQMRGALAGVESAARRASAVSRKLTTFSHRGDAMPEVFDVGAALTEMQPMLHQLFGPDVRVAYEPPASAQLVRMDRSEFELVVLNLAANANTAMPEGGRFGIVVQALGPARVALSFSDTGRGMDEAVRRRVFEPFFTTSADGQGSGLGLAVVSEIVSVCGGRLDVDSSLGNGTTFRIELPLADAQFDASGAMPLAANV
ncbi:sensor histidine kinase [Tahibacter caeni]|uniref:sensor histidine kinase n=1 Tax=Tahibacter caeni TaxID=1453545 RepID=UPI0021473154|nr:ATP-binding protein [Tahibacter caeni]